MRRRSVPGSRARLGLGRGPRASRTPPGAVRPARIVGDPTGPACGALPDRPGVRRRPGGRPPGQRDLTRGGGGSRADLGRVVGRPRAGRPDRRRGRRGPAHPARRRRGRCERRGHARRRGRGRRRDGTGPRRGRRGVGTGPRRRGVGTGPGGRDPGIGAGPRRGDRGIGAGPRAGDRGRCKGRATREPDGGQLAAGRRQVRPAPVEPQVHQHGRARSDRADEVVGAPTGDHDVVQLVP